VDPAYALAYRTLYRTHWWWRARERMVVALLRSYLAERAHRILDIGCGAGLFFEELEQFGEVEGVEADVTMKTGSQSVDGRIHWGPLESFRPAHQFSAVLMLDVLEHLPNPAEGLRHAVRVLQPGGVLVVTVPALPMLWTSHDVINQHLVRYTRRTLGSLAAQTGLIPERLQYFFHWLVPAKLVVRLFEQMGPHRNAPSLPRTPVFPINDGCYLVSRLEQICFGAHPFPFGSSLLMVARCRDRASNHRVTD
jgi:trans-aconitate methyltransferase